MKTKNITAESENKGILNQDDLNAWHSIMTGVCPIINQAADLYETLPLGEFSKEIFIEIDNLGFSAIEKRLHEYFESQGATKVIWRVLIEEYLEKSENIVELIKVKLKHNIDFRLETRRYFNRYDTLKSECVPFDGNRAKVSPEALEYAGNNYFTKTLDNFELELKKRLECLEEQMNQTLQFAREKIYADSIFVFYDEDEGGQALLKRNNFGSYFTYK